MSKRIISLLMIALTVAVILCGCFAEDETLDPSIITDGKIRIGLLTSDNNSSDTAELIASGFNYAHSLADSVNITENIDIEAVSVNYSGPEDTESAVSTLINSGVCAVVCDGFDLSSTETLAEQLSKSNIPVVFLNSYLSDTEYSNMYTLSVTPKYMSSVAATYAMEKGYNTCAVLLESDENYYQNFAEVYKGTLKSYIGAEPTVYYLEGEKQNFNSTILASGNYDYIFLVCSSEKSGKVISDIRAAGLTCEIMLTEVFDKASVSDEVYNNCSFISKLEPDINNNISTVFYSTYSEYSGVAEAEVSSAAAYGYDGYMMIFEALKSFASSGPASIFSNTNTATDATAKASNDITLSEFSAALSQVAYYGVTDTITFMDNTIVPTYIYVDNIINAEAVFGSKYSFNAESTSAN